MFRLIAVNEKVDSGEPTQISVGLGVGEQEAGGKGTDAGYDIFYSVKNFCFLHKVGLLLGIRRCKGTKNFGIGGSVLFRLNVEAVDDVEEGVARQCVVARFGATLGVDFVSYVAELAEYVEAVENECESTFENAFADAGVPDKMIVVEATVGIAAAAVHGNVGADAPVIGQFGGAEGQAIVEIDGIDGNEAGHARRRAAPFGVAERIDREPRGCAAVDAFVLSASAQNINI